jgi:hypothetical protein
MSRPSPWPDEALIRASPQGIIAYNLGNLLRRLVRPVAIRGWSLTSLQQRLL